ncbi:MAG: hypothetical protein WD069_09170 [Planctomycetales bacterium]
MRRSRAGRCLKRTPMGFAVVLHALALGLNALAADVPPEFRVKREAVFEFTEKPRLVREGDRTEIMFAVAGFCDATVAIEDAEGRIVRHLASGVLGKNAPPPFQRDSRAQRIVWDGKDDAGSYVRDVAAHRIRVSLGLKPRFERNLYWSPKKRFAETTPLIHAAEDGVYVFEGKGVDHLRVFDHDGDYLRTVYPFPADKLERVEGLNWHDYPQGDRLPLKNSQYQHTLLTAGPNALRARGGWQSSAATMLAVGSNRIALASLQLNRLATDGSTGGLPLTGPEVWQDVKLRGINANRKDAFEATPTSGAFSPDGKTLYLSGYLWRYSWHYDCLNGVARMRFDSNDKPEVFAGSLDQNRSGTKPGEFRAATSVACDAAGRVYVSDYMNDRVQVFAPEGEFLKAVPVHRPAIVRIDPRTQELYVFSWLVHNRFQFDIDEKKRGFAPKLYKLGPFDDPRQLAAWDLPLPAWNGRYNEWSQFAKPGVYLSGEVDAFADPPTVWIGQLQEIQQASTYSGRRQRAWEQRGIQLLREKEGKLEIVRDFARDVKAEVKEVRPPLWNIQRLHVNPANGKLYIGEADSGPANKTFTFLIEADPATGEIEPIELPFSAEDAAFDRDGHLYLRNTAAVVRYDMNSWREIPWDYGEEMQGIGSVGSYGKGTNQVAAGLAMPAQSPVCFHQGGMYVTARGDLIVACHNRTEAAARDPRGQEEQHDFSGVFEGQPYAARVFPGREFSSTSCCLHVWDRHGRLLIDDAVPGMPQIDGVGMDAAGDVYVMATPTRRLDGKPYFNRMSETLMKFSPKKGKLISKSDRAPVPVTVGSAPDRPLDLGSMWAEGAEWLYGGVGFAGFNAPAPSCACWHGRFALDYFGRSFAPEPDRYQIAVLDSAGNLVLRVGRYGNVDSSGPESLVPLGGDEVALMHATYVAAHTDRRLFIADFGNARIVSVKLDYHATETLPLGNAAAAQRRPTTGDTP